MHGEGLWCTDAVHLLNGPCYCTNKMHTSMAHPNRDDANSNAEVCNRLAMSAIVMFVWFSDTKL